MPRHCCVPGCRSNYKGEPYTNVFSFPKDPEQRVKWEKQIHRKDFKATDSSVVCIQHFAEEFLERNHTAIRDDGTLLTVPRKSPVLVKGAYPTIFLGQPSYMSTQLPVKRKHPEERLKEQLKRNENEFEEWCLHDKIVNFELFKNQIKDKLPKDWILIPDNDISFGKVDVCVSKAPIFTVSVKICSDFIVSVWRNSLPLPKPKLTWLLGSESKCDLWSKWDSLISFLNGLETECNADIKLHCILQAFNEVLEDCEEKDDDLPNKETLLFLRDQLNLCLKSSPRYQPGILLWAAQFYFSYPAAYKLVRNSSKLVLPHSYYLKSLIQNLGPLESGVQTSQIKYLKQKNLQLSDREKLVILMMDEIYVKTGATYKGGKIDGLATNSTNTEASTLQAFFISSIFSRNKDVVGLYPVKNQNADQLFDITLHILKVLKDTGYTAVCVISDNNRVNRKTYEKFCGGVLKPSIENPVSPGEQLFLLFDTVHILKSIRNNWLNNKETNQTFYIPPMKSLNINMDLSPNFSLPDKFYASVSHLFGTLIPSPAYILLGKFQMDELEARFGQYRTMCGGNYHVSVTQVLESERKLKILSLIHLKSAKEGEFTIKDFLKSCKVVDEEDFEASDFFYDILLSCDLCDNFKANLHVLIYIAGYVAKVSTDHCSDCRNNLTMGKALDCEIVNEAKQYLSLLDRGGLLWPNDILVNICMMVLNIFQTSISLEFEDQFLQVKNQRHFICALTKEKLSDEGNEFKNICKCGKSEESLVYSCINIMANILLNNYTKIRNDNIRKANYNASQNKSKAVNRKLLTLQQ